VSPFFVKYIFREIKKLESNFILQFIHQLFSNQKDNNFQFINKIKIQKMNSRLITFQSTIFERTSCRGSIGGSIGLVWNLLANDFDF
jgi:hypothetical protein